MDKTILEKRIKERAEERFDNEFREFVKYIYNHPIGGRLKVKIGDSNIPIANFGRNYGLFNEEGIQNKHSDNTNLQLVKMSLLRECFSIPKIRRVPKPHFLFDYDLYSRKNILRFGSRSSNS